MEGSMADSASILLCTRAPGTSLAPETHLTLQPDCFQNGSVLHPATTHCTLCHPISPAEVTKCQAQCQSLHPVWQKDCSASSYHIFINELAEILKAMLFCYGVWIVAILVGYAVGLQCSRACKQQGSKVLQPVSCREVKQCWQLLISLICENRSPLEPKFFSSSNGSQ